MTFKEQFAQKEYIRLSTLPNLQNLAPGTLIACTGLTACYPFYGWNMNPKYLPHSRFQIILMNSLDEIVPDFEFSIDGGYARNWFVNYPPQVVDISNIKSIPLYDKLKRLF